MSKRAGKEGRREGGKEGGRELIIEKGRDTEGLSMQVRTVSE